MAAEEGLKLIGIKEINYNDELYKLIDFLNKTLKNKDLIFGLTLEAENRMVISIYEAAK